MYSCPIFPNRSIRIKDETLSVTTPLVQNVSWNYSNKVILHSSWVFPFAEVLAFNPGHSQRIGNLIDRTV